LIRTVAVVGSGMAGLAAAHRCRQAGYDVTVFEALSGHGMDAHALTVQDHLQEGIVDVPLRVMSPGHWQSVLTLAAAVGVGTFSVDTYVSCSLADRQTWFRSGRMPLTGWPFVGSWRYLDRRALTIALGVRQLAASARRLARDRPATTLQAFLDQESFDPLFWRGLVLPLLTTICTCDERHLLAWPAHQLLSLLDEIVHGGRLQRLQGGTSALVQALSKGLHGFRGSPVARIADQDRQVLVQNARGEGGLFDRVIIATQANQLDFLEGEQYRRERDQLQAIRYDRGELLVHTDDRFAPRHRHDWTALNFVTDAAFEAVMFTVWVNAVEPSLADQPPVFQTWNPLFPPLESTVLARVPLQRAVVHSGTANALQQLSQWHRDPERRVFYCGAWAHEGVPLLESAVRSAHAAVDLLEQQDQAAER